MIDGDLNQK